MSTFVSVPDSVEGWEEANELLRNVHGGITTVEEARGWVSELRREGLTRLAEEVECRLPPSR
ncbi:MAG: hypothetical protein EOP21_02210 [Hyphomicrobiales bacterium]|nr:MAG: hypothetical protein EOP21_02210 [Hyphomicrobiales bacterium]